MRPALVAVLLLIGCKKTPATETDVPTPVPSPQGEPGVLDCNGDAAYWRVSAPAGTVSIAVDTVDAATTFDIGLDLFRVDEFYPDPTDYVFAFEDLLDGADDEAECTFPPPDFACPVGTAEVDGADFLAIVYAASPCTGDIGEYDITVTEGTATLTFLYTGPDPALN